MIKVQELFENYTKKYAELQEKLEERASFYTDFDKEKKYYYMANEFICYYLDYGEVYQISKEVQEAAIKILQEDLNTDINELGTLLKTAKYKYLYGIKKCDKLERKIFK